MNKQRIELESTSILTKTISRLGYTIPEISQNDKSASWDGFIHLYATKNTNKKSNLAKRIPIQVKGHYQKPPYNELISFPVETSDLRNYLNESGVIFFVIYLDENDNHQIYYSKLTKLILKRLLKAKEEQKTISINLEKFPSDTNVATDIFFSFADDMNMSLPQKDISIIDVCEGNLANLGFDSLTMTYSGINYKDDPWGALLETRPTLYLTNSKIGFSIPIETNYDLLIKSSEELPISIENIKYYDNFERIRQKGNIVKLNFGKSSSFTLKFEPNRTNVTFHFHIKGNLIERINDTKFIIDFVTKSKITLGDKTWNVPFPKDELDKIDINYLKNNLNLLDHVNKLFTKLKVKEILNYDQINNEDEKILILLINTILLGGTYKRGKSEKSIIYNISIANISIKLIANLINETECYLLSFFDEKNDKTYAFTFKNGPKILIPKTFVLREGDFANLDNIDYDVIFSELKKVQTTKDLKEYTYYYIDEMIKGYMKREKPKDEFRNCILECLEYLIKEVPEYNYSEINQKFLE